jgi:hypothetical protein
VEASIIIQKRARKDTECFQNSIMTMFGYIDDELFAGWRLFVANWDFLEGK